MGKLIYSAITSLDGYVEDAEGRFDWAAPDDELHSFVNDLERGVGTYLYGRRMYETMRFWEDPANTAGGSAAVQEYGEIWRAAEKVVYSRTLEGVASAATRIEREFDPDQIRRLKETASRDLSVGGAELAALAIEAGLVEEYHLFVVPVLVGGGKRALSSGARVNLELLEEGRFGDGSVYLRYGAATQPQRQASASTRASTGG